MHAVVAVDLPAIALVVDQETGLVDDGAERMADHFLGFRTGNGEFEFVATQHAGADLDGQHRGSVVAQPHAHASVIHRRYIGLSKADAGRRDLALPLIRCHEELAFDFLGHQTTSVASAGKLQPRAVKRQAKRCRGAKVHAALDIRPCRFYPEGLFQSIRRRNDAVSSKTDALLSILKLQPVVPVLIIEDAKTAVAAGARAGGRWPEGDRDHAAHAGRAGGDPRGGRRGEGAVAGAGTVLNARQWDEAVAAGSKFIVSPGTTETLLDAAAGSEVPLLPGAATASEVMTLLDAGQTVMKFFRRSRRWCGLSQVALLAACRRHLLPDGRHFAENARDYLTLPNVVCVGGSGSRPKELVEAGDLVGITKLASEAFALRG